MHRYITIDGGTTSTRAYLVENKKIVNSVKSDIGVGKCVGKREVYVAAIKNAVENLLSKSELTEGEVERIIASGMITSEFGLCNLPHICTPAGVEELHATMYETVLPEITQIPFVFIRGVKSVGEYFDHADMMRGEETELVGMIADNNKGCVYVLPGSHSKIIETDENNKITGFSTMLTGEMIAALSQNTILKDAVDLNVSEISSEYLLKGYDYAERVGLNKALFKVRILKNLFGASPDETYSFFMGIVLCDEIKEIIRLNPKAVIIGGKSQIKSAMTEILKNRSDVMVAELNDEAVENSTVLGAIKIYEG